MSAPAVLLVEDYPANALVGQTYITHCGFQCDVATTREQVLRLATANEYAVIFMDLRLGDDCGLEITKRLREREAARGERRRRIIAMTASAMLGDRQRCIDAGMDDYISKPFRPQDIYNKLKVA